VKFSNQINFESLYKNFNHPITSLDCGRRCAPYNEYGLPFCCDISQTIPTVYIEEWEYLQTHTDLWHVWRVKNANVLIKLREEIPKYQIIVECLGHRHCQRSYRSITCRSFPFYPYFTEQGEFIGLSYYWQYADRCWVINNLHQVSSQFRDEFYSTYNEIFKFYPSEQGSFIHHSRVHRQVFGKRKLGIPLLHKNGRNYLITPRNGQLDLVDFESLPKHGPYEVAAKMPFPDERDGEL